MQELLTDRYGTLRTRLTRRLGSQDWAEDALQETYLRLDGAEIAGIVRNPTAYLFRTAFNVALNRMRADRRLSAAEVDGLLHVADEAPDALQIFEGRAEMERLSKIIAKLPERQRAILLASRVDGVSRQVIADRFGISVGMVDKELQQAQEYCAMRFGWKKTK
ncbi:RNA polymerase sigma factor [Tardiphaga sp.]|uniref:RNA polymerase sigma factor n=1 Tax=Tardiphaga sp. TaxID=1926292 RepID=UPI0037DA5EF2